MTKPPGIDWVELGAYKSTEPLRIMLFTALNFSPPWAASAALARSIGEVVAEIVMAGVGSTAPAVTALTLASPCANALPETDKTRARNRNDFLNVFITNLFLS